MKGRKKHSWKRVAALLLIFAMVINMIPADVFTTFAATATHQNDFTITVKDTVGNSIPNAIVSVTYGDAGAKLVSLPSDGNGEVVISQFTDGTAQAAYGNAYTISCTAEGYVSETKSITVENTDTSNVDIVLYKSVTLTGVVSYKDVPEVGATVTYTGDGITTVSAITGETGQFTIPNVKKAANPQLTITSTNEKFQEKVYTPVFTEEATTDCGNIALDVKTFDITFSDNGIGTFADEAGNAIPNNTWNVEYGTDVAFSFTANTGYENVAIVANDVALEAMDGKYVIRNVTVPYTVVAQGEDTQAPTISNVNVSDAKNWTKEKEITFIAEDNSGITPTTYVLPTLYDTYEELQEAGANAVTSPYKVTENGTYYIYAVDAVGNMASESVEVEKIDRIDPVISITSSTESGSRWHKDITYIFTVTDEGGSGVNPSSVSVTYYIFNREVEVSIDESIKNEDGSYTFSFTVDSNAMYNIFIEDNAGNFDLEYKSTDRIDMDSPYIIELSISDEKVWVKDSKSVEFIAKDNNAIADVYYADKEFKNKEKIRSNAEKLSPIKETEDGNKYSFSVEENGTYYIYVFDAVDRWICQDVKVEMIDKKEPEVDSICSSATEWTNQSVTVAVKASDEKGSGINRVVYGISKEYNAENCTDATFDEENNIYQFDIPAKDLVETYYVWAIDNVGNISKSKSKTVTIKIDITAPENVKLQEPDEDKKQNGWYTEPPKNIIVQAPAVQESESPVTVHYKVWNSTSEFPKLTEKTGNTLGTNKLNIVVDADAQEYNWCDGIHMLEIWTTDEAGNTCEEPSKTEIKIDTANPTIENISIEETGEAEELRASETIKDGEADSSKKYFDKTVTVTIEADDGKHGSGVAKIQYQKKNFAVETLNEKDWVTYDSENKIVVKPNDRFIIYARAIDNAGRYSDNANSIVIIVDNKAPEGEKEPKIYINPDKPNANDLHNGDVNVEIKVIDPKFSSEQKDDKGYFAGIEKITYEIFTTDTNIRETGILFDETNNVNVGKTFYDDNLVYSWSGNKVINAEKFNSNNVYIKVVAVDNAGNTNTISVSEKIAIDVTAPTIDISYDNNTADNSKYFKANRTATITVTERNFDAKDVLTKITNTDGTIPSIGAWQKVEGTGNKDNTKWITTVTYSADGDYTFDIGYTDLAGNACSGAQYGTSVAPTDFTVDKTLPVINVSYDNNSAQNGKYFKDSRTATVTIKEHNFDVERVKFTQTASKNGSSISIPAASWTHSGDTHTARFSYAADGDYTFDVSATDMAGNESEAANYGNSVAGKEFTVDQTIEKPSVTGVENGKAYKDEVIPKISFQDINYDSHEIKLVRTRKGEKNVDVTNEFIKTINKNSQGASGVYDTFAIEPENDGIYTLTVKMVDKAGNEETEEITFTVNRFGSVYEYDDYLVSLISNGGSYEQTIEGDLIITEYNADRLVGNSLVIEITRDGKPLDNVIYDVTPGINDKVKVGESGWYQYQYTISKDNFKLDGVYKISISSKDASGNSPENSNYEDKNILFRVDSTLPEITSIVGLEESIINAPEVKVNYTVYDTIGLKSIKIMVNGKQLGETITDFGDDLNNYTGFFMLSESKDIQNVRIIVEDLSGNITDTDAEEFVSAYTFNKAVTVSTKWYIRWFANKPLFWGTVIGGAALLAVLFFIILAKRKKDEEEEA